MRRDDKIFSSFLAAGLLGSSGLVVLFEMNNKVGGFCLLCACFSCFIMFFLALSSPEDSLESNIETKIEKPIIKIQKLILPTSRLQEIE